MSNFEKHLGELINRYSIENKSNTPDIILAEYLKGCLEAFNSAINKRDEWYGIYPAPGKEKYL